MEKVLEDEKIKSGFYLNSFLSYVLLKERFLKDEGKTIRASSRAFLNFTF